MSDPILPGGEAGLREAFCAHCGSKLTAEEQEYYGIACERCELEMHHAMQDDREPVLPPPMSEVEQLRAQISELQSDRTRLQEELAAVDLAFEGLEETDRARRIGHWIGLAAAETTRANAAEADRTRLEAENERLRRLATGAAFHFFCCGDGACTDDACGQLVPAMADLAKAVDFSSDPATNAEIAAVPPSSAALAQPQPEERK